MTSRLSSAGRVGTAITAAHSFVPTAVVFDDARAVGDGELIERIFTNREVEWRALETLDRLLNAELSAPSDPRAVVRSLEQQLDEITAEAVRQTLSYKQVTHNLSLTHAVWSSEAAVGERLDGIRAITRRNLHAARAHRQRR